MKNQRNEAPVQVYLEKETRYYRIFLIRNLFGQIGLWRIYGRIGSNGGQKRIETFSNLDQALIRLEKLVVYRVQKRGYKLTSSRNELSL